MFNKPPELCGHSSYSQCTPECEEKARKFDEWVTARLPWWQRTYLRLIRRWRKWLR